MQKPFANVVIPALPTRVPTGYVVVAWDYFTKWPEAVAVPDQDVAAVCEVLI